MESPAIWVGARNKKNGYADTANDIVNLGGIVPTVGGWFGADDTTFGYCDDDSGYPYGSRAGTRDNAGYTAIAQNVVYDVDNWS